MQTKTFVQSLALAAALVAGLNAGAAETNSWKFSFGGSKPAARYQPVGPTNLYSPEAGFGFEPGAAVAARGPGCTSDRPFYFSVALPEGNYQVTVKFGGDEQGSTNTVKSELRRLMLEKIATAPGKFETRTFTVNVRRPRISDHDAVHLKPREKTSEIWAWDEKLTLEFNGTQPSLCTLEIEQADSLPTVYLLGDSTVCDQPKEPWNSWGQMLPRFFSPGVAIANHAESGESLRSSLGAKRVEKVFSLLKPGDYVFVQFGHNDMKERGPDALPGYKSNLKKFVADTKSKGGIPVLVTSMERKSGVAHDTLDGYPAAVREVAKEEAVPLIDLHAMSRTLYNALGQQLDQAFQDGTHHNNYGSYELAKCVIEGIKANQLGLAKFIAEDFKGFDPSHPDSVETFEMPLSPGPVGARPLGD